MGSVGSIDFYDSKIYVNSGYIHCPRSLKMELSMAQTVSVNVKVKQIMAFELEGLINVFLLHL